jgi:hypothetical protein
VGVKNFVNILAKKVAILTQKTAVRSQTILKSIFSPDVVEIAGNRENLLNDVCIFTRTR